MNADCAQPGTPAAVAWSPDQLVDALNALDVPFLAGGTGDASPAPVDPAELLAGLAASDEARLRLAIIPLLLRRPELAVHADDALARLPAAARLGFRCFYTAAVYLQQMYAARLSVVFGPLPALPDRYSQELGVAAGLKADAALAALAARHKTLSGQYLNWHATYLRGADTLLTYSEARQKWPTLTVM